MKQEDLQKTATDYAKYITDLNLEKKLEPINKSIEEMLARLEEFETMFGFIQPDIKDSSDLLNSILDYRPEFDNLCSKIDSTEFIIAHIKNNLDMLDSKLEETESKLKITDTASKVTNIFTPLFKKGTNERKMQPSSMELFKTENYFLQ